MVLKMKDAKYNGFTIGFGKGPEKVYAYLKSAPKRIGSVDKNRPVGSGFTKKEALEEAKRTIEFEIESFERITFGYF